MHTPHITIPLTHVFPNQSISKEAIDITQIHVLGNKMFFQSTEVNYKLPHNALEDFISFMSTFPEKPLFVGHNIKRLDCHVLYNALKSRHMWNEFSNHVCGFLDTLDYLKKLTQGLVPIAKLHLYKHFYLVRVSWLTMPMMMLQHFFSFLRKRVSLTKPG